MALRRRRGRTRRAPLRVLKVVNKSHLHTNPSFFCLKATTTYKIFLFFSQVENEKTHRRSIVQDHNRRAIKQCLSRELRCLLYRPKFIPASIYVRKKYEVQVNLNDTFCIGTELLCRIYVTFVLSELIIVISFCAKPKPFLWSNNWSLNGFSTKIRTCRHFFLLLPLCQFYCTPDKATHTTPVAPFHPSSL